MPVQGTLKVFVSLGVWEGLVQICLQPADFCLKIHEISAFANHAYWFQYVHNIKLSSQILEYISVLGACATFILGFLPPSLSYATSSRLC